MWRKHTHHLLGGYYEEDERLNPLAVLRCLSSPRDINIRETRDHWTRPYHIAFKDRLLNILQ